MFLELFLLFLTLIVLLLFKHYSNLKKWDHFPGAKGYQAFPLIGHAYMLGDDPIKALLQMQKKHGNIFRLDLGPTPGIIIAGLDEANTVFKSEVIGKCASVQ